MKRQEPIKSEAPPLISCFSKGKAQRVRIAVVYDNRSLDRQLSPSWGFSCLVGDDLLFDTGGDGPRLVSNMARMGFDPRRIRSVVLSHAHGDHTGGIAALKKDGLCDGVHIMAIGREETVPDILAAAGI